jgi:molybdate transport system ATP-binding protein
MILSAPILKLIQAGCQRQSRALLEGISLSLSPGQGLAVLGPAGSGKTSLLLALSGELALSSGQREAPANLQALYLGFAPAQEARFRGVDFFQMRWDSFESEDQRQGLDLLGPSLVRPGAEGLLAGLGVRELLSRRLPQLSTGELRRLRCAQALLNEPGLLCLDDPFAGLDAEGRSSLSKLLGQAHGRGQAMALALSRAEDLPPGLSLGLVLQAGRALWQGLLADLPEGILLSPAQSLPAPPLALPACGPAQPAPEPLARLRKGRVAYGSKLALDGLDWELKRGQRWLLEGPNGSGKSTLLALISADHPQAYANDLVLFGRQRGTGESIWEIKARIGLVDPAQEAFFDLDLELEQVVVSGLHDQVALRGLSAKELALAANWLKGLQVKPKARFGTAPALWRRLALLARALIKRPALLLCDEACRGLDPAGRARVIAAVEAACGPQGPALVWVSHHPDEDPHCLTHCLRLQDGRAAEQRSL